MTCSNEVCAKPIPVGSIVCPYCAAPVGSSPTQSVSNAGNAGRDIQQYQAGRDLIFYPQSASANTKDAPDYEVKWSWRSPLTLAVLTWVSVVVGILSLGSAYKVFEPLLSGLFNGSGLDVASTIQPLWIYVLLGFILLFAIAMLLRRIASNETQHLSRFSMVPAITGWGKRIGLARLKGQCVCGGKLRFYSKPVGFSPPDPQTGKQRVTEREMSAECVRDPKHHTWRVETTDRHEDAN